ncbi:MAG: hypothetical protein COU81_01975 [Candidatus Portnoybacteria bacterium CG10_big_fil_rev_8_21_14_0_10_36_7]|uniref:Peptidase A2 domain-containing protein n=1 Tax=Candidatus Portnoybacteria bacterium CG10_big_fil_rev_8_21_14_0_10_36_7 TaxID=1974812 RepID=A0A2M8KE64_9BACT|nr:MAG: hypothetical protein COU81_01975 [Candidatus Portnoybacteria bacterium CG10_big_fil_rev_8_21_14_0_10_36_7]
MWQKTFEYKKIGNFWKPIIPVSLKHNKKELKYVALLDSGADFNIFHSEITEILDIDLTKLKKSTFGGINKGAAGSRYMTVIEIGVDGYTFDAPVYFSTDISLNGYGIVGQEGFFDKFKILFNREAKKIELKKLKK